MATRSATQTRRARERERAPSDAAGATRRAPSDAAGATRRAPSDARESARGEHAPRQTASARREALIDAAVRHFAQTGLHGTAVSAITDEVGITQPYAFSLFGTKKGLFLAAVERGCDRIEETFRAAAERAGEEGAFDAMKESYASVLADRSLLLLQLQSYAASGDDEVRDVVRRRYAQLYELVRELSGGASRDELTQFFAVGMLLNVAAALDLPQLLLDDTWLQDCLYPPLAGE
jgi:AcrR family transcriptional regulator